MTPLSETELAAVRDELSRAQIRDAMFRYCRGVDRADQALIRSAYHDDSRDWHGKYQGPSAAFAAAFVKSMPGTAQGLQHLLGNMLIELDGESAHVETYFFTAYRDVQDLEVVAMFGGRYLDRFERRDGEWKIANRTVVNDWTFRKELPRDTKGDAGYPSGRTDLEDLVFQARTWAVPAATGGGQA
jgi:hypothetical protein